MPEINDMRRKRREGKSISEIARETGRSRPTVRKYLEMEDFSPVPPEPKALCSPLLDPFRADIEATLDEDERNWRKQRHPAERIFERLRDERGCGASYSTVRRY